MKTNLMLVSFLVLSASAAFAGSEDKGEGLDMSCSAETIDADGTYNPFVRTECGSEFAGQCAVQNAQGEWQIADKTVCDKAAAKQGW